MLTMAQHSMASNDASSELSGLSHELGSSKFPHTRAQLSAIARQYKPSDGYEGETDSEIPTSLVNKVASLLVDENEDDLKVLLRQTYGMDDETLEQNVLDLMHKHRDDIAGVPFLFLTPTRRPTSRPSSRASTHSGRLHTARPDTPISAPASPLGLVFRRPHTPVTSPLAGGQSSSYMTAKNEYSPQSSPVLPHSSVAHVQAQYTASLPASPISSSRHLNAKASEFKPIPRPLSAASSNPGTLLRADTPSPDMWAHNSPRATSNLAIAAPLIADQSRAATPSSSLRSSLLPTDDTDEEDPFDPFVPHATTPSFHSITVSDFDSQWSTSPSSSDPRSLDSQSHFQTSYQFGSPELNTNGQHHRAIDIDVDQDLLTDGMTPFDVLSSVFGSTLAPSELEDALASNGYDFDHAMAWLVDRALPVSPQSSQVRIQPVGGRVTVVSRDPTAPTRGGRGLSPTSQARGATRYVNGRPMQGANRVCRYFVAGECLRADCRFSHDLERALCRFWLRGTCAKQDSCEFLHHLPKDADVASLNVAMSRANVQPTNGSHSVTHSPPQDEFPALGYETNGSGRGRKYNDRLYDPSRTRFAAAVKKAVPRLDESTLAVRREVMGTAAENIHHQSAIIAPRPSPRLKLHPPTLLPTLQTGDSVNNLYMAYRARALQLGAARNACLSRAADAWRRGDGAAAKRFSREGHDLNAKMSAEMATAASKLVKERVKLVEHAVRSRDAGWSDDPYDRVSRGKVYGGGLGVCLGVARKDTGDSKLSSDERTECVVDLHGLHSNEATEVLEEFLLALEHENFYGLAYAIVGEEKHTGTQDVARGASRARLATGVREWVHRWGYPWSERDGIICIDPLTHATE